MKKVLNRLRDRWRPATYFFIEDEEGVGVVEIILILVENLTIQNLCGYCGLCEKQPSWWGFGYTIHN